MRKVHFFKAKSRIGIPNPPVRQKKLNIGVEEAADKVLSNQFLSNFESAKITEFVFSKPEDVKKDQYWGILTRELTNFKNLINRSLKRDETQVVLGGDNGVTLASILAVLERLTSKESFGYIQFDSHGEMNLYSKSPSKNFHGMYMRALLDHFDILEIEELAKDLKLNSDQILTVGDQVLDGDEQEFYRTKNIRNITRIDFNQGPIKIIQEITSFIARYKHIHINFDVDVFDSSIAPATGIAQDGRWLWNEVVALLKVIKRHSNISVDLCEINPRMKGAKKTITIAQKVLQVILI